VDTFTRGGGGYNIELSTMAERFRATVIAGTRGAISTKQTKRDYSRDEPRQASGAP
jgi:hypothetical protein